MGDSHQALRHNHIDSDPFVENIERPKLRSLNPSKTTPHRRSKVFGVSMGSSVSAHSLPVSVSLVVLITLPHTSDHLGERPTFNPSRTVPHAPRIKWFTTYTATAGTDSAKAKTRKCTVLDNDATPSTFRNKWSSQSERLGVLSIPKWEWNGDGLSIFSHWAKLEIPTQL